VSIFFSQISKPAKEVRSFRSASFVINLVIWQPSVKTNRMFSVRFLVIQWLTMLVVVV